MLSALLLTRGRGKENGLSCASIFRVAPVAQRIRVLASEAKGRGFESRRARQSVSSTGVHLMKHLLPAAAALALAASTAFAQQYPTRNVSMIVPYAAGGPTDTVARVTAQAMGKPLGQTIIV